MNTSLYQPSKTLFFFFISLITLAACQKEKDHQENDPCSLNTSAIAGKYVLTSIKYKVSAPAQEQDYMIFMDDCEKDDVITLNVNGTYAYTDLGNKCSPDGSDAGTWSLSGKDIISDGIVAGTVEKFDCKSLVVYTTGLNIPGDRLTMTITRK